MLAVAVAALLAGCDGFVDVEGRVLAWDNAPPDAESRVLFGDALPDGVRASPLPGALAALVLTETDAPYRDSVQTDAEGRFRVELVTAPLAVPYRVEVRRDGFRPAVLDTRRGDAPRDPETATVRVVVLLVREPGG